VEAAAVTRCPTCGAGRAATVYRLPNGNVLRCGGCATLRRENLVAESDADRLYDDDAYLDAPYFEALKVGAPRDREPYLVYRRVLERLGERGLAGRLLDVGCSYGAFLELAAERGWEPHGVELSAKACGYARRERGLEVFHGTLEAAALPPDSFRVVTLWDVIEHLERPLEAVSEVHRILAPGGVLVLFTINQASLINRVGDWVYRLTLGRWTRPLALLYDIHHNFFFDAATLEAMLRRAGYARFEHDWLEAHIERWQNVAIPAPLALGTKLLDLASRHVGQPYRMVVFAYK
jgi:SAM-dependent methyltransferase